MHIRIINSPLLIQQHFLKLNDEVLEIKEKLIELLQTCENTFTSGVCVEGMCLNIIIVLIMGKFSIKSMYDI